MCWNYSKNEKTPKNAQKPPKTAQKPPFWRFGGFSNFQYALFAKLASFVSKFFWKSEKLQELCKLGFWNFWAPPRLSPDQIGKSKQKTGTLSFNTPKYMILPNSQCWFYPIFPSSPQMGSQQKFHSLNKLISKKKFSKIFFLTHPYKSYVTIKNMFSHQISHIIMYSAMFWDPGVTLLRLLRCTNMSHFESKRDTVWGGRVKYVFYPLSFFDQELLNDWLRTFKK